MQAAEQTKLQKKVVFENSKKSQGVLVPRRSREVSAEDLNKVPKCGGHIG